MSKRHSESRIQSLHDSDNDGDHKRAKIDLKIEKKNLLIIIFVTFNAI